jgi:tetratricopeptide (TPR) repeat protein
VAFDKLAQMEKLDPLYVGTYTEWSKMGRLGNNPSLAVAAVRRGLAVMPKGSDEAAMLYQELINIPREGGRSGEAISAALEYTAAQPERIGAWRQLAELYELNGQRELAVGTVNGALERFASRKQGAAAAEYAALQKMVTGITYGAAGAPRPAPGQAAPGAAGQGGVATASPAISGRK